MQAHNEGGPNTGAPKNPYDKCPVSRRPRLSQTEVVGGRVAKSEVVGWRAARRLLLMASLRGWRHAVGNLIEICWLKFITSHMLVYA